eukprot:11393-Heterococcus_DN1.PRE.1
MVGTAVPVAAAAATTSSAAAMKRFAQFYRWAFGSATAKISRRAIAPDAQLHTAAASKANDAVNTDKQLDGALKELVAV